MDVVLIVKNRQDSIVIGVKALLHVKAKYFWDMMYKKYKKARYKIQQQ